MINKVLEYYFPKFANAYYLGKMKIDSLILFVHIQISLIPWINIKPVCLILYSLFYTAPSKHPLISEILDNKIT